MNLQKKNLMETLLVEAYSKLDMCGLFPHYILTSNDMWDNWISVKCHLDKLIGYSKMKIMSA